MIRTINIHKRYASVTALDGISITIETGKITALVGDNGSGKSTLVRILSGTEIADEGTIHVHNQVYQRITPKLAKQLGIATVYQDLSLDEHRAAYLNLFLGQEFKKYGILLDHKRMIEETEKLRDKLNIDLPDARQRVSLMSGGQRQSLAMARSIYMDAECLLLDEPTAAMGIRETAATNQFIMRMRDASKALLLISHDMAQVMELADIIYLLRNGRIIAKKTREETSVVELVSILKGDYP